MSFSASYLPAALLTILSLSASLCAQSTNQSKNKETPRAPRGSISGRVTIKDKGVPGIAIGLRKGDVYTAGEQFQRTATDQDGYYRIANVAAGSYAITVAAPAYVPEERNANRQKSVLVNEGENVEDVNFTLVRGGVITGRVTDADGHWVIEQQVNIYPAEMFEQRTQRQVYATGSVQTDDRGIYRVFGLSSGRYKVAVGRSDNEMNVTYNQPRNVFYKQVFHPDVSDQAKATIVEVSEGGEANNIDITVGRMVQTFSASGQLVDELGQPVPNLRFGLQRQLGQRVEYSNNSGAANSRGEFIVEGLVPGKYAVMVFNNQTSDLRVEPFTFDVVDHDVIGLTVKLTKGTSISGFVILENEDKAVLAQLLQLQLRAFGVISMGGDATFASGANSPLGPDGSFRLSGLPGGTVNMSLAANGVPLPPKGFMITRIERNGFVSQRLEVKDGEQVTGVRVFVAFGSATLRGTVTVDDGPLPEKGRIFVRLTRPGETFSNLRPPVVDQRGRFLIEGLPAGTYELQINVNLFGQVPRNVKREVTLQDGQTTDLTINVDSNEPAKP